VACTAADTAPHSPTGPCGPESVSHHRRPTRAGAAGAPRAQDTASTAGYATRPTCRASGPACWSSGANRRTAGTAESPTPSQARTARCWWRPGCQLTSSSKAESRPAGGAAEPAGQWVAETGRGAGSGQERGPRGCQGVRDRSPTAHDAARPRRIPEATASSRRVASASSSSPWKRGTTGRLLPPAFGQNARRGRRAVDTRPYLAVPGLPGPRHERPERFAMDSPDDLLTTVEVAQIEPSPVL
jgi:hypothetical protein